MNAQTTMQSIAAAVHGPVPVMSKPRTKPSEAARRAQSNLFVSQPKFNPNGPSEFDRRADERKVLASEVEAFLARGGQIQKIAYGKSGLDAEAKAEMKAAARPEKEAK